MTITNILGFLFGMIVMVVGYSYSRQINLVIELLVSKYSYQEPVSPEPIPPVVDAPVSTEPPVTLPEAPKEDPTKVLKEDPNVKKWVTGNHLEWRIPEGKTKIILKYKEKNGRLIVEYPFSVKENERIEIEATSE